jgi:hypothetical protein
VLYGVTSFVKGATANSIADKLLAQYGETALVFDTDFSSYDNSQFRWT